MGKRIIKNLEEVLCGIKDHPIWELKPLFPEIHFPKRKGVYSLNYFILCPFLKEKHPSFCFDVRTQLFSCFSCGLHGDIIDFYVRLKDKTFFASVIRLAKFFKIKLVWDKEDNTNTKQR
ncbi:MAG TPA: CHC2 zinc finger domain-containing protein [Candidatus Moranbacteria bacterium]|nr:CHC2 zinc finger domain-containing protein [Candidatus Moranbacteria bacterium]